MQKKGGGELMQKVLLLLAVNKVYFEYQVSPIFNFSLLITHVRRAVGQGIESRGFDGL